MAMCGGLGNEINPADDDIKAMCASFKEKVEADENATFSEFTAISFRSQVVAGTNYFVKVHVGDDKYVHLRVFKPLPHTKALPSLACHRAGMDKDSPIEYFE